MTKKVKNDTGHVYELFGISKKRTDEIIKIFESEIRKNTEWPTVVNNTRKKAKIKTVGEGMYLGWLFRLGYSMQKDLLSVIRDLLA